MWQFNLIKVHVVKIYVSLQGLKIDVLPACRAERMIHMIWLNTGGLTSQDCQYDLILYLQLYFIAI